MTWGRMGKPAITWYAGSLLFGFAFLYVVTRSSILIGDGGAFVNMIRGGDTAHIHYGEPGHFLQVPLADTLCGTRLLARRDYERFAAWRSDFGEFDPFGDFELLFPAAVLGLGMVDVPVAYRSRTYGSTNIRRFRDGFALLRMALTGFVRFRLGGA